MEKLIITCTGIDTFMAQFAQAIKDGYSPANTPSHFPYVTFDGKFHVELEKSNIKKK